MKKSWPQSLILIGGVLAACGIAFAILGAILFGLALFLTGLSLFLVGSGAVIVRRRLVPHLLLLVAGLTLAAYVQHRYCFSLAYIRSAHENPYRLWITALKGIGTGPVYYIGSEGEFSYFRAGTVFADRFKAPTTKINLPRTFPLGSEQPYRVTAEMVSYSASNSKLAKSMVFVR